MIKKPRSKRRYAEKECANSEPHEGSKFVPHDSRQAFCTAQCRINWHNDLRKINNITRYAEEAILRKIDKTLELLYRQYATDQWCIVEKELLAHEEIDVLNYSVSKAMDTRTETSISWYYGYGISFDPKHRSHFIIHKK